MTKTKFVNITQFAKMKKCSRETIYSAGRKGELDIDRTAGFPVIYLTEKNNSWKKRKSNKEKLDLNEI